MKKDASTVTSLLPQLLIRQLNNVRIFSTPAARILLSTLQERSPRPAGRKIKAIRMCANQFVGTTYEEKMSSAVVNGERYFSTHDLLGIAESTISLNLYHVAIEPVVIEGVPYILTVKGERLVGSFERKYLLDVCSLDEKSEFGNDDWFIFPRP